MIALALSLSLEGVLILGSELMKCALTFIQSWRVMILLILVLPFSAMLFYWCHTTNSLGEEGEILHSLAGE